ncbi:YdiU family protein [Paracoccus sp. p3-h83]|uniref:protein adenylyltransferase SelO n=1 Tax=Paracoccus sp. p3-h83 TaxID=3342805 RepID=UPI0035B7E0E6
MTVWDNSYARLPDRFFARQAPTPVRDPQTLAFNAGLAARLGVPDWGAEVWAGNALPPGAEPIAQLYAGHQFGQFTPQLGDGRAVLLGEVIAPDGARFDLQLKGAGRTAFSRGGDGRAWLGPVLREYLVSEYMAAVDIPTTRALAAATTGEVVWRDEGPLPGAVLTRVAASHIRIGTFQVFAARRDTDALAALTDHAIARHHPGADGPLGLLKAVVAAQADLIAGWMGLGFIHGVMNTDNMTISGETIDYGPCAFMDGYHPGTVFSAIDRNGRYAWANQPQIGAWNLAQLATALLPLMGADGLDRATEAVHGFAPAYHAAFLRVFGAKLGLADPQDQDRDLIDDLLALMAAGRADFTRVFAGLADGSARDEVIDRDGFDAWAARWQARAPDAAIMARANPRRIPRNHRIQQVIEAAVAGDPAPFHALLAALTDPFTDRPEWDTYALPPSEGEAVTRTFCGT